MARALHDTAAETIAMYLIKDLCGAAASLLWPVQPTTCLRLLAWAGDGADLVDPAPTKM